MVFFLKLKQNYFKEEADLEQRAIKSQKRRELELEKREHDKKKTIDRLLLKKDTKQDKTVKASTAKEEERRNEPKWSYIRNINGATLSLPFGVDFPLSESKPKLPPKRLTCSVEDCNNPKIYNCAKTGEPLCSFECYQKNLANKTILSA
jgi:INO80 complex subunit B